MINKDLIQQCKRRERKAFQLCYEATSPYVFTIVKSYIFSDDLRRDVMQEVYANIFNSLDKFDESKGTFKNWIARITVNQCINFLRKNKKLSLFVPLNEKHKEFSSSDHLHLDNLKTEELNKMLKDMPTGYRTIFLLNIIDGYSHKEISKLLGITKETSRSQLSRAINWIRKNILEESKTYIYG